MAAKPVAGSVASDLTDFLPKFKSEDEILMETIVIKVKQFINSRQSAPILGPRISQLTVRSFCNDYVLGDPFPVSFMGGFQYALKSTQKPTLTVEGCAVGEYQNQTDYVLSFNVIPPSDFFPKLDKSTFHIFEGALKVAANGPLGHYTATHPVWFLTHLSTKEKTCLSMVTTTSFQSESF